jgi:pimeloyl-ACP methyl ester carboxylesterase
MYYFNTERGRSGLAENRQALCRYLWSQWSPTWKFDAASYAVTAAWFDNPDFVEVVIRSYRHRFGGVAGDPSLDRIEAELAHQPGITVPSIVLLGSDDGVEPPPPEDVDRPLFLARYERRMIDAAGHNLPQEKPEAFASALLRLVPKQCAPEAST